MVNLPQVGPSIDRVAVGTILTDRPTAGFEIDRVASREGRIVLASGAILQFDHRGRVYDELERRSERCY